jgi:antitoxin YefM
MDVLTFTDTRKRLKDVMDRVVDDHVPTLVTRQKADPVVMVSLADWTAMEETLHLMASRANTERLLDSIAEMDAGNGADRGLIDA